MSWWVSKVSPGCTVGQFSLHSVKVTWMDIDILAFIRHLSNHLVTLFGDFCSFWVATSGYLSLAKIEFSSANVAVVASFSSGRSDDSKVPVPRLIPGVHRLLFDKSSRWNQLLLLCIVYLINRTLTTDSSYVVSYSWSYKGGLCARFYQRPIARPRRLKKNTVYFQCLSHFITTLKTCSTVECRDLKPNWWFGIRLFFSSLGMTLCRSSFSKTWIILVVSL